MAPKVSKILKTYTIKPINDEARKRINVINDKMPATMESTLYKKSELTTKTNKSSNKKVKCY